jgi:hypothetical protein
MCRGYTQFASQLAPMKALLIFLTLMVLVLAATALWQRNRRIVLAREHSIRAFVFPTSVLQVLTKSYPHLQLKDLQLVARSLRQFFIVHARAKGAVIVMPSKVTDALWHAFILDTRAYRAFCQAAFGAYFHHIPEGAMKAQSGNSSALWLTWYLACLEENISPGNATRLPLLFAIDAKLSIPGAVAHDPASFKRPADSGGCGGGSDTSSMDADGGCGGGCGGGD